MSLLSLIKSIPLKTAAAICLSAVTSALFSIAEAEPGFRKIDIGHAHLNVAEWLPADSRDELVLALPGSGGTIPGTSALRRCWQKPATTQSSSISAASWAAQAIWRD